MVLKTIIIIKYVLASTLKDIMHLNIDTFKVDILKRVEYMMQFIYKLVYIIYF